MASTELTTLKVCGKKPEVPRPVKQSVKQLLERSQPFRKVYEDESYKLVQGSEASEGKQLINCPYGFVSTCMAAYNYHHDLIIRPDDVWQAILTQFSLYVQGNSEKLRDTFVDFEGKKKLTIYANGTLFTTDFGHIADRMVDEQIVKNIKDPSIRDWMIPDFSTTTSTDRVVASVSIMSALQNFFSYGCMLCCGIPSVTLLGSIDDWERLRQRIDRLPEFEISGQNFMEQWHSMLTPVFDAFIETKKGQDTSHFWNTIFHHIAGGSGPSYYTGWITCFAVFTSSGKWQGHARQVNYKGPNGEEVRFVGPKIETSDVASGVVSVPMEINDNGTKYESHFFTGQIAAEIDGTSLQSRNDWCIVVKPAST